MYWCALVCKHAQWYMWMLESKRKQKESWWPFPSVGLFNLSFIFSSGRTGLWGRMTFTWPWPNQTFLCIHYYHGSKLTFCQHSPMALKMYFSHLWYNLDVFVIFYTCVKQHISLCDSQHHIRDEPVSVCLRYFCFSGLMWEVYHICVTTWSWSSSES